MVRAKLYAYLLNFRGNINLFFKLLDKLNARVLAYAIVDKPKHAHAVIMLSQKLDKKLSSELAKHGCYLNFKFLRNSLDVDKAINYVVNNPSLHKSSGEVYSVRFINSNAKLNVRGEGMSDRIEERLNRLEDIVSRLAETVEQLANKSNITFGDLGVEAGNYRDIDLPEKRNRNSYQASNKQANNQPAKVTLKQGKYGYMLFLNSYKMVRGKPMVLLSGRDLTALRAEIDKLLSRNTKSSKANSYEGRYNRRKRRKSVSVREVEGYENALAEE